MCEYVNENGKKIQYPAYRQWANMLKRCPTSGIKFCGQIAYLDCTVCSEWLDSRVWLDWAKDQIGFLNTEVNGRIWCLDKDILLKGNKHYSPDTCVFIPNELNCFLTLRQRARGSQPLGVHYRKQSDKFAAQGSLPNGRKLHLGYFDNPDSAWLSYKTYKENRAKMLAAKYEGLVDPRVTRVLLNYEVHKYD